MAKLKEWIAIISLIIMKFKLISALDDENTKLLMERMNSMETVQEFHSAKMELIENEVTGLKKRVDSLEIKDRDILGDLGKLDRKFADLGISISSLTSPKVGSSGSKGIPTSCSDLKILGHSNNGLYSVKKSLSNNQGMKIETVYCDFQSPLASKGFETRIGVVDVKSSPVHFYVKRQDNVGGYGEEDSRITFLNELFNVGDGFDWKNQIFRAPFIGIYLFSISGLKEFDSAIANIDVKLNNEVIGKALSSHETQFGGFSYQFTVKLVVNDTIELVMRAGKIDFLYFTGSMLDQDLTI